MKKTLMFVIFTVILGSPIFSNACESLNPETRAHLTTWTSLRLLGAIPRNTVFSKAGGILITDLKGFESEILEPAKDLAFSLDYIFTYIRKTERNREDAVSLLYRSVVDNRFNTVCDLADEIDRLYTFFNE